MTETVRERGGASFSLAEDTFDAATISMLFVAEIEAVAAAGFV